MAKQIEHWRYYFPDDMEIAEDAYMIQEDNGFDAEDAARYACEYDYDHCDGWERGNKDFRITVIAPDGTETTFIAQNIAVVEHIIILEGGPYDL